jgi:DNA mismatch repair protein MutS2
LSDKVAREVGFADVRRALESRCKTPFGIEALSRDRFPETLEEVEGRCEDVLEAAHLVRQRTEPDFPAVREIRPSLEQAEKGFVLGPEELLSIAKTVAAIARLKDLMESRADEVPRLVERTAPLRDERRWAKSVADSFDDEGKLADDASPALKELRDKVRALRVVAQEKLEGLIRSYDHTDILRERNFTVRNDRYVLPVRAEHQGKVEGIVHDASQTGQTVFIEPRELMDLGNRIKIARASVVEEEKRILEHLTLEVREHAGELREDLAQVGRMEALFAQGIFAAAMDATKPTLQVGRPRIELTNARHPLLLWQAAEQKRAGETPAEVVPNDLSFGDRRALVITGPNAGGKTVALKTLGLCAVLARAGLPIPAEEGSRLPAFASVVGSIGDQQSLDDALSSFSGHLEALKAVLAGTREHGRRGPVLALLDELAAGTDPSQGAAFAQSVLETLVDDGAFVVATTHYQRLKLLAIDESRADNPFRNASLALEAETLRPTFRLRLDQVGTSNALEAARRQGLPDVVVERAESLLTGGEQNVNELLGQLATQQGELERRIEEAERERTRIEKERERLATRLDEVEREANRLRREGARAFEEELASARKVVAIAIERAQSGADARELNDLSHGLQKLGKAVDERTAPEPAPVDEARVLQEVAVGDTVELVSMPGTPVEVLEVDDDEVLVARGALKMRKPRSELRKAGRASKRKDKQQAATRKKVKPKGEPTLSEPRAGDNTLDLRGERVHDALELLEAFMDKLLKDGRTKGWVLHGHGTGALKKAVRDTLKESRYVKGFRAADPDDGGDACTEVSLADARL